MNVYFKSKVHQPNGILHEFEDGEPAFPYAPAKWTI